MRRRSVIAGTVAMLVLLGPAPVGAEERVLVVVASKESPIETITTEQIRLSYLAVPLRVAGVPVMPVLNTTDPLLHEVFLQKVIFLSDQHYRRQVMAQVFRSGGVRPVEAENDGQLVEMVQREPGRISYMWQREANRHRNLKSLRVLWRGSIQ